MARTWLAIKVELLGGRGDELWPAPGRVIAVGPAHTFRQLAEAIDLAFARWDPAHLRSFTLIDGTVVTDPETAEELEGPPDGGDEVATLDLDGAKPVERLAVGEEFRYVFDFGDEWTHRCTVLEKINPDDALGASPRRPTAYDGWGSIPDQYGRRWEDDDGEDPLPARPARPDPMLSFEWPRVESAEPVDLRELRGAVARRDVTAIVAAVVDRDVEDVLQLVGSAWQVVLASTTGEDEQAMAASLADRLRHRGAPGDEELAEDLVAVLRGTPLVARHLPVDLSELASELDGSDEYPSGVLDLTTGEVVPGALLDPFASGEDAEVDVEAEPDRWLELERLGPRDAWDDMATFAAGVRSTAVRGRLEEAIQGRGAFRRFRDVIHEEGLVEAWLRHSDDRTMGRARAYLAERGIRVSPAG